MLWIHVMILVEILTTDAIITHLSRQHSRLDDVIWQPPEVQGVSINILSLVRSGFQVSLSCLEKRFKKNEIRF